MAVLRLQSLGLLAASAAAAAAASASGAQQLHLSLTGSPSEMHAAWAASSASGHCTVAYGTSPGSLTQSADGGPPFKYTGSGTMSAPLYLCDATMTDLTPATRYYYSITSEGGGQVLNFTSAPAPSTGAGRTYALLADFGDANDVSLGQLVSEAGTGALDVVIHAGDLAYDLEDEGGAVGNAFMANMAAVASRIPWQATVGNHEADSNTFSQFRSRFYGLGKTAGARSGSNSSTWYSFDDDLVHWIALDTELWAYGGTRAQIAAQQAWLERDLASVDRSVTPWVIAYGHKQRWMDKTNFSALEDALLSGGVDMYICGHTHNYQRIAPNARGVVATSCIVNTDTYRDCRGKGMVTLVVGSPGCKEGISTGTAPGEQLVKSFLSYGYGHVTVNATQLSVMWEQTGQRDATGRFVPAAGADVDTFVIQRTA